MNWTEIFTSEKYFRILIDAIKYNQDKRNLEISAYVLMKNHFHLICRSDKLINAVSSIKSYSAKRIIQQLKDDNRFNILKVFEKR
ncbi:MAG: transposase [Ignavibacteriae bacterium]|nr:transposase [Ignavibacteriota bacterium]